MLASIVIRVKNERENLKKVLEILKNQTEQDFEVIIVDDNSTDGGDRIVFEYFPKNRVQVIKVPKGKFTHPLSTNLGAAAAKGEFIVFINGHAFPISNTWLPDGLANFSDPNVAGVFAIPLPHSDTNIFERFWYYATANVVHPKYRKYSRYDSGVLGTTNAIIRKDLWEKHHFNETLKKGGEDVEWAKFYMNKGYFIVQDARFRVRHSHHFGLIRLIRQHFYFQSLEKQKLREK